MLSLEEMKELIDGLAARHQFLQDQEADALLSGDSDLMRAIEAEERRTAAVHELLVRSRAELAN